jgi:hypothetical protein
VFNRSKCTVQSVLLENVYSYELIFK